MSGPAGANTRLTTTALTFALLFAAILLQDYLTSSAYFMADDFLWLRFIRQAGRLVAHLPFPGFVDRLAGRNRYFYLASFGFAVLLAQSLLALHAWLLTGWGARRAALAPAGLVLALGVYSLAPARLWQIQMQANSNLRRAVVDLAGRQLALRPAPPAVAYLAGFPKKLGDLDSALDALYGQRQVENVAAGGPVELAGAIIVDYNQGAPVTR